MHAGRLARFCLRMGDCVIEHERDIQCNHKSQINSFCRCSKATEAHSHHMNVTFLCFLHSLLPLLCWMWLATFSREPCTKSVHNLKFYTLFAKLRNLTHWLGWHSNFVELFIHSILENFFVFHSIRFASRINIEYRRSRWRQVMHVILMGDHCPYDFCCFIVYALIVVICKWTEHTERERGKNQENLMNK